MNELGRVNGIEIMLNGVRTAAAAGTLEDLVRDQAMGGGRNATALNGRFVAEAERVNTQLCNGDRVEIVSPRQGG